jgi:GNAT superfamily N-acetyltransferase
VPAAHPDHDAVAEAVRGWFTTSEPSLDITVSEHWYGYLSTSDGPMDPRLLLTLADPAAVAAALGEARAASGGRPLTVWIDDRDRVALLDDALRSSGATRTKAITHLALVGEQSAGRDIEGLSIREAGIQDLEEWCEVKLRCFGDTEEPPSRERLTKELDVRRPEMALADLWLATIEDEPVGVLAFYRGNDQLVFNLGTRVAFRHRGIAQTVLARWVERGRSAGCRSLMINADDPGRPRDLYLRLGFTDEIFWFQRYVLAAE